MAHRNTNLPVALRLHFATAAAVVALIALSVGVYIYVANQIADARVSTLRHVVDAATSIVSGFEARERDGRMTRQEAQTAAAAALRSLRHGGDVSHRAAVARHLPRGDGMERFSLHDFHHP